MGSERKGAPEIAQNRSRVPTTTPELAHRGVWPPLVRAPK